MKPGALFLDRDGTLMCDGNYLSDPGGVVIMPGAPEAIRKAGMLGYRLFLFTNQSGISRGMYTLAQVLSVNARMLELMDLPGSVFDDVCIAPEHSDEPHGYRKPSPRFILEMIEKHNLDSEHCYMVGDAPCDLEAGLNAGITPIALDVGGRFNPREFPEVIANNLQVFPSLLDFVATLDS